MKSRDVIVGMSWVGVSTVLSPNQRNCKIKPRCLKKKSLPLNPHHIQVSFKRPGQPVGTQHSTLEIPIL